MGFKFQVADTRSLDSDKVGLDQEHFLETCGTYDSICNIPKHLLKKEARMRQLWIVVLLALVLAAGGLVAQVAKPKGAEAEPTVFCNVIKEPDPALLGGWKCVFPLHLERGELDTNPAEYWLVKVGDKYALHFDRIARNGRKRYTGWKVWTLNGKEITSDTGVRIYTEGGQVFFKWKDDRAVTMTKVDR
jgi:hypothetical protein